MAVTQTDDDADAERDHIRLVIVEDEPLFRDLLGMSLATIPEMLVVATFGDAGSAQREIASLAPDVAILDINLGPGMTGVALGLELRRQFPKIGIILLSNLRSPQLLAALPDDQVGGWSYLLKQSVMNVESLAGAIHAVLDGLTVLDRSLVASAQTRPAGSLHRLTLRQLEILRLVAQGQTNAAIAEKLVLGDKSVENHLSRIYQALDINTRDKRGHPRVAATLRFIEGTFIAL